MILSWLINNLITHDDATQPQEGHIASLIKLPIDLHSLPLLLSLATSLLASLWWYCHILILMLMLMLVMVVVVQLQPLLMEPTCVSVVNN